jgi:ankyrin repeat protein
MLRTTESCSVNASVLSYVQTGDLDELKKLCATVPKVAPMLARHKDFAGSTPLLIATANNHFELIKFLIDVS